MAFELVELSTGNLVGYYGTRRAALRDVLNAVNREGEASVETLALGCAAPGEGGLIAKGRDLVQLAYQEFLRHGRVATARKRAGCGL